MIVKSVVLPCSTADAFALFSARIDDWWPPERRHIDHSQSTIELCPERFSEHDPTGREVDLGRVRAWDPPHRILLDWYPGTDPEHPTEVEVLFVPEGTSTRVEVRHRAGPKSLELFPMRAPKYERSWDIVLAALGRSASLGSDSSPA